MDANGFLSTLRQDILEPGDVVDVRSLNEAMHGLGPAISRLESAPDDLAGLLQSREGTTLAALLLGVQPTELVRHSNEALSELQRWQQWTLGAPLSGVVVGLLLKDAQSSRSRRRRTKLVDLVNDALVTLAGNRPEFSVSSNEWLPQARRSFDFVVSERGEPILAVLVIFQTRAGGRQTEIFQGLPELQSTLIRNGLVLAVVADGPGFLNMSQVVRRVAPRLQHLMNVTGLRSGELAEAAHRAGRVHRGELKIGDPQSEELLDRVALVALRSGRPVTASLLNAPIDATESFLLRFSTNHPAYDLRTVEGQGLIADASQQLNEIGLLAARGESSSRSVLSLLVDRLGYGHQLVSTRDHLLVQGLEMRDSRLRLPSPLPVFEIHAGRLRDRSELIESIDEVLRTGPLVARLAVVIDLVDPDAARRSAAGSGRTMRPQLAVLGHEDVAEILLRRRAEGREFFIRRIVESVDLRLVSPFVSEGPAPESMFFGRETEIRRIMEQAGRQSFALVGGRKAGKTSILRRLEALLRDRLAVVALDCQAHPDRADFLRHVLAQMPHPPEIGPAELIQSSERVLATFVEQVLGRSRGVILLDEVDELFLSDSTSTTHPHVLSRAFRSLAQVGMAAVVVTGERALYRLTRDPSSPHWNFCTPVVIGPLSTTAAESLLVEPMETMGISVDSDAVQLALQRTARHPNLLQYLGDRVVDALAPQSAKGERLELHAGTIRDVVDTGTYQNRFLSTFWSQATTLEKIVSLRLATSTPLTVDELTEEVRTSVPSLRPSDILEAVQFLELYTIAINTPSGWILREPAFETYLGSVRGSAVARQWLDELA